jgi:GTP-binding protein
VTSGNGGNGCYTFIQPRGFRSKIPAGGNGGKGGDVWISAKSHKKSLKLSKTMKAENGNPGQGKDMHGRGGADKLIFVPVGTIIREVNKFGKIRYLDSLDEPQKKILIAEGGKGGRGNKEHADITEAEKGEPGKRRKLQLELKLIADIGLVGYPNAGKTTLLAALTRACPKIASYPFTTLQPYLGIIEFIDGKRITVADMPGIIEGAAEGKGLGHDFLKHIQRTKGLVYVLDINDNPERTLLTLYNELKLFDEKLIQKPFTIVLNKADLVEDSESKKKVFGDKAVVISAKYGKGLFELVSQFQEILKPYEEIGKIAQDSVS